MKAPGPAVGRGSAGGEAGERERAAQRRAQIDEDNAMEHTMDKRAASGVTGNRGAVPRLAQRGAWRRAPSPEGAGARGPGADGAGFGPASGGVGRASGGQGPASGGQGPASGGQGPASGGQGPASTTQAAEAHQRAAANGRAQDPAWSWAPGPADEAERLADEQRRAQLLRVCTAPGCTASLLQKNAHARFCSDACRKRTRRASPVQPPQAAEAAMGAAGASARAKAGAAGPAAAGVGLPSSVSALRQASAWLGPSLLADGEEMHLQDESDDQPEAQEVDLGDDVGDDVGVDVENDIENDVVTGLVSEVHLERAQGAEAAVRAGFDARRIDELFERVDWMELSLAEGFGDSEGEALRSMRAELAALRVDLERGLARASSAAREAARVEATTAAEKGELAALLARVAALEGERRTGQVGAAAEVKALRTKVEGLAADLKGLGARVDAGTARDREVQAAVKELKGQMADVVRSLSALAELV